MKLCFIQQHYFAFILFLPWSSNGNISHVIGPLCGEFTGHRWIPCTKASDAELWYFFDLCLNKHTSKQLWGWRFGTLSRHYDAIAITSEINRGRWLTSMICCPVIDFCLSDGLRRYCDTNGRPAAILGTLCHHWHTRDSIMLHKTTLSWSS